MKRQKDVTRTTDPAKVTGHKDPHSGAPEMPGQLTGRTVYGRHVGECLIFPIGANIPAGGVTVASLLAKAA